MSLIISLLQLSHIAEVWWSGMMMMMWMLWPRAGDWAGEILVKIIATLVGCWRRSGRRARQGQSHNIVPIYKLSTRYFFAKINQLFVVINVLQYTNPITSSCIQDDWFITNDLIINTSSPRWQHSYIEVLSWDWQQKMHISCPYLTDCWKVVIIFLSTWNFLSSYFMELLIKLVCTFGGGILRFMAKIKKAFHIFIILLLHFLFSKKYNQIFPHLHSEENSEKSYLFIFIALNKT